MFDTGRRLFLAQGNICQIYFLAFLDDDPSSEQHSLSNESHFERDAILAPVIVRFGLYDYGLFNIKD